jgi:phenylalanyl-tRNA synthetase beta chain
MVLKKGNIRGQESNGMMVSEREMGLSDEHEGIIDLPADTKIGTPMADLYGLNDPVIDVALTPDRADCAGVRGIARDLAAAGLGTLKPINTAPVPGAFQSPVKVSIQSTKECPQFLGRYIKGVKNGASPEWLQQRLKAVGLRPISALVDITNFFSVGLCRPLHVFDADKLSGNIHVRLSKAGEAFEALNDKSYTLEAGACVVCDDRGVLGLGGIVGGQTTGCQADTVNVFLECAYFDPYTIAKTGRHYDVVSDARYRFERGVDPAFTAIGIELATRMIIELCGGEPSEVVSAGQAIDTSRSYDFDPDYTRKLGGVEIPVSRQTEILHTLGFVVRDGKAFPPSWRGDILGKADLVEEIVRVHGFDHIPAVSVRSRETVPPAAETALGVRMRKARGALAARGLYESVTWSFMPKNMAGFFGSNDNGLTLSNPISADLDQMRPSILPNLLMAAGRNADRGFGDTALFEVGPVFQSADVTGQKMMASGVRHGACHTRHWSGADVSRPADAMDAKADALTALEAAGAPAANLQVSRDVPAYYHPGRAGALKLGNVVLAYFGDIHPGVMEQMGLKGTASGFEVFLDHIPDAKKKGTAKPLLTLSPLQPISRDFAFIVDEQLETALLVRTAMGADKMIERIDIFDVYQGKGVDPGKKSVAINVVIQPKERTLTDADIETMAQKIISAVAAKCAGVLRG